jgi:uncharacterized protein
MPIKPSEAEEEYFARRDFEERRTRSMKAQQALQNEEREKAKDLHFMKCPKCGMDLAEIDYRGLKIDKCTSCQGVWLDSGELEQVAAMDKGAIDKFFNVFRR